MEPIEHDPKTKSQIKQALNDFLYQPVRRHFEARIEKLINRNTSIGGYSHKHFVYKGTLYTLESTPPSLKKNRLVPQLKADMEEYLRDLAELNDQELPYVLGFINSTLNSSRNLTDYVRILPESVHGPLNKMMMTCPCRATSLDDAKVKEIQQQNQRSIELMKQRQARNLLL